MRLLQNLLQPKKSVTKKYRVSGTITEIQNPTYGNLKLKDDTGEVLIFGVKKDKDAANTSFSELGAEVGDKLTVVGFRDEYNGTIEMTSGYCEKLEKDTTTPRLSVSTTALTAKAGDTSASFDVKGNVKWTVSSDNAAYTVSPASGEGAGTVTVKFAANTKEDAVKVNFTVSTTADVATKSYTVVLTHQGTATVEADYSSNVKWTAGTSAYNDKVIVNGGETQFAALKLGKGTAVGSATMVIPAGTKKISFYAYAWKGKKVSLSFKAGETALGSDIALKANDGCTSSSPYKLVKVSESDMYTIDVTALNGGNALASDVTVTVESVKGTDYRAVIFAVNAE